MSSRCHCGTKANACHSKASSGDHCSKFCTNTVQCSGKCCQTFGLNGLVCSCHWWSCWLISRAVALSSCASATMSSGSNLPMSCGKPFLMSRGFCCQYSAKNCSAVMSGGRHSGMVGVGVGIIWSNRAVKDWRDCSIAGGGSVVVADGMGVIGWVAQYFTSVIFSVMLSTTRPNINNNCRKDAGKHGRLG